MPTRVVQWTTGNVGKRSVRAVVARPDLELIGCYAWSPDKAGRDVGELCGIDPIGVSASNDIDGLRALKPDCVDKITIDEGSDTTLYDSPETELLGGFGGSDLQRSSSPAAPRPCLDERRGSGGN